MNSNNLNNTGNFNMAQCSDLVQNQLIQN